MKYESVIGLEVHTELKTATKIFCGCSTAFGGAPNTQLLLSRFAEKFPNFAIRFADLRTRLFGYRIGR